jgi:hypothetical protein
MSEISRRAPSPSWNAQSTAPAAAAAANSNRWVWVKFKPLVTPGLDPALSDLFSAELELALDRLAGMQNRLSESAQSQPTKRS